MQLDGSHHDWLEGRGPRGVLIAYIDDASSRVYAQFMLNLLDVQNPPSRHDVEAYLKAHFATPDGSYRIPVHQDFLQIRYRTHIEAA